MRLDIGAGAAPAIYLQPRAEWRSVDLEDADYDTLMWDLPFATGSIEEIHSSHALEHIEKVQVLPTLREWYRVLAPKVQLTIRVPDLAYCCEQYLAALATETSQVPVTGWNLDMLFGNQEHEGQFHKTGFTRHSLTWYVIQAGFRVENCGIIWSHNQQTIELIARKP